MNAAGDAPGRLSAPGKRRGRARFILGLALAGAGLAAPAVGWLAAPLPPRGLHDVPVTSTDWFNKPSNNSPQLAVDPTEKRFVVAATRQDAPFSCGLQASGDGGRSWVTAIPVRRLPPGAETCYAPEAAFDAGGTLHYVFAGLAGAGNRPMGIFHTYSTDRARTFAPPRKILGANRFQVRTGIDPRSGRMHLVWLEPSVEPVLGGFAPGDNPILAAHSDDGGRTFSEPVRVSDAGRKRAVAPALAIGPEGQVHVAYYDLGDDVRDYEGLEGPTWEGRWEIVVASSTDGGRTFGKGTVVEREVVPTERVMLVFTMAPPALAAGPDGALYAAWADARNGDWDVLLRATAEGGGTWGLPRRLSDDAVGSGTHQYMPQVSVAPNGRVDAVFYDRRTNVENRGNDVFFTHSSDRGGTFAPNMQLTSWGSDSVVGPRYAVPSAEGMVEFGSRIALRSDDGRALAAWTDTRYTAERAAPAQDVFGAEVVFAPGRQALRAPGLALAAAGAALALLGRIRIRRAAASIAAALMLAACDAGPAAPLPPRPPVVDVTMRDNLFELSGPVPRGRVVFNVRNAGRGPHRMTLIYLPDAVPDLKSALADGEALVVDPLAGVPARAPGAEDRFAADMDPGRWGLVCFLVEADGTSHAEAGMALEFGVR